MPSECALAFKEWAAVCAALAAGRQTALIRKGGIQEGPGGFRPEHPEFWLLPTYFHERPAALREADRHFFAELAPPADDHIRIELFASVAKVFELADESRLAMLEPWHVYGSQTIHDRFHYRRPGLFLLAVRIYRTAVPFALPAWPELAGCRTWVDLPRPLPTAGLEPVLSDAEFAARLAELQTLLR